MIGINGCSFVDELGRTLMLRGANLGGSSKVPRTPEGATHLKAGLLDHRSVSFVGRPFALEEADEHFSRLRHWGMTFLRFLITWEAVEHAGPGIYDEAYMNYLHALIEKAGRHGISLFIDPHQDMWSRFSGGDGAPGWTLEAVGFDLGALDETGAAITHQFHGDPFPKMVWPTNSGKLAAATMFTLFFAGDVYAPKTLVEGEPAQQYLQRHYIDAMTHVARRLADLPNVVGYDAMNEPLPGYVGWKNLAEPGGIVSLGNAPTGFQGMLLGDGIPQEVGVWEMRFASIKRTHNRLVNRERRRAWRDGLPCVWRQNGVWDRGGDGAPVLLRPDHFARVDGRAADFPNDFYRPFAIRFARAIRSAHPRALIFIEADANRWPPRWTPDDPANVVFAPHWYDDLVLVQKRFLSFMGLESGSLRIIVGRRAIRESFARQLARLKEGARECMCGAPTLLAEFGIPFDMNGARAYRTGGFGAQERALDRSFQAVEANLLDCTIWNYTSDNTNKRGDQWNGEDLSIYSEDQRTDPADVSSGGRGLRSLLRPYPRATAGTPLHLSFDFRTGAFSFAFRHDPDTRAPTEIFLPSYRYARGCVVSVSDGDWEIQADTLVYRHGAERQEHVVRVTPRYCSR
ncbi:MAG: cellulase family glycosylhydrolase [Spirochaetia bacterium]